MLVSVCVCARTLAFERNDRWPKYPVQLNTNFVMSERKEFRSKYTIKKMLAYKL